VYVFFFLKKGGDGVGEAIFCGRNYFDDAFENRVEARVAGIDALFSGIFFFSRVANCFVLGS
jgi:hypothetical protein